jgi:hypothetical protein
MAKVDVLIYPVAIEQWYPPPSKEYEELKKKLSEVEPPDSYDILANKGLAELAKVIEERLNKLGLPYIVIRGLEPPTEKDEEEIIELAETVLSKKFKKKYGYSLRGTRVLRVPRYDEWKDPPEESSTPNWLWLAAGVAGAVAVPLLLRWLSKNP